jgi:hypothetical protein
MHFPRAALLIFALSIAHALVGCYRAVTPGVADDGHTHELGSPPHTPTMCPPSAPPSAYLWAENGDLYTFDPVTVTSQRVGHVSCATDASPETLAVSRDDVAYVEYNDGSIFRLDLSSLACASTAYRQGQLEISGPVNIALSSDADAERMYMLRSGENPALAIADLSTFTLREIAAVDANFLPDGLELKSDASGRLFALSEFGRLIEIDGGTGRIVGEHDTAFQSNVGWALLTWNDRVYFLGGETGEVDQFDPAADGMIRAVGRIGVPIVGAGSAACLHE